MTTYPLSSAQLGIWLEQAQVPQEPLYNIGAHLTFAGFIDANLLEQAFRITVGQVTTLRLYFLLEEGEPRQAVAQTLPFEVERLDFSEEPDPLAAYGAWFEKRVTELYDLSRPPLFRAAVVRMGREQFRFALLQHHLIIDGLSFIQIARIMADNYTRLTAGVHALPPDTYDYLATLPGDTNYRQSEKFLRDKEFWTTYHKDTPPAVDLSGRALTKTPRRSFQHLCGHISAEISTSLCQSAEADRTRALLAALVGYMARITGNREIVFTLLFANRHRPETRECPGLYMGGVLLRVPVGRHDTLTDLAGRITAQIALCKPHAEFHIHDLVRTLGLSGQGSQGLSLLTVNIMPFLHPIFFKEVPALPEMPALGGGDGLAVTIFGRDASGGLDINFAFNTALYDPGEMELHKTRLLAFLASLAKEAKTAVWDMDIIPAREREILLRIASGGPTGEAAAVPEAPASPTATVSGPEQETLFSLFREQAARTPDRTALIEGAARISYARLDRLVERLARHLHGRGISLESIVGVYLDRSLEQITALLAALRLGAAWLPLDPQHPEDRTAFMIKDSGANLVVTRKALAPSLAGGTAELIFVDALPETPRTPAALPDCPAGPDHLAYIIYTSGSTGKPKGVLGLHRGMTERIRWMQKHYPFGTEEVACHKTATTFVDAVTEAFGPLVAGVPALILKPEILADASRLIESLAREKVTRLVLVPSLLQVLLDAVPDLAGRLPRLRLWVSSGETLLPDLAEKFHRALPERCLLNLYGSSEVSADVACYETKPAGEGPVPIGKPLPGSALYILDPAGNLAPVGVRGEIYVGGLSVARGYLGAPRLTAERFVPDPFGPPGARLFRTGDLGWYRGDGELLYSGRKDRQVKIRGYRVEPGEVQSVLTAHPEVRDAFVLAIKKEDGTAGLAAYLVAAQNADPTATPTVAQLRRYLKTLLPAPMIPETILFIPELPLNASGKVDIAALPAEEKTAAARGIVSALTPQEQILSELWTEVLKRPTVGAEDNFFDLGGDSLTAIRLIIRINRTCNRGLAVSSLFEYPSIRRLARHIRETGAQAGRPAPALLEEPDRSQPFPLSHAQQRLWILHRLSGGAAFYHQGNAYLLRGDVDLARLEQSIHLLSERHEALRSRLTEQDGTVCQIVDPPSPAPILRIDLGDREKPLAAAQAFLEQEMGRPFLLDREHPFRPYLLTLGINEYVLAFIVHHAACDGLSGAILIQELEAIYSGLRSGAAPLPPLKLQYADYARWQRVVTATPAFQQSLSAWVAAFQDAPTRLVLPQDHPRSPQTVRRGLSLPVPVSPETLAGLREIARLKEATLFMALLAAYVLFLSRRSGQVDVITGIPAAGRGDGAWDGVVGFFANTLPIRVNLARTGSFSELIVQVRRSLLTALDRQDIPFDCLVEALRPERDPLVPPLVQTMFVLQDLKAWELHLPDAETRSMEIGSLEARFDLSFVLSLREEGCTAALLCAEDIFDRERAGHMAHGLAAILQAAAAAPESPLTDLSGIGEAERLLLTSFACPSAPAAWPLAETLPALLEKQRALRPQAPALERDGATTDYAGLALLSDRMARFLINAGIRQGDFVGLAMERSVALIAALLGIMRAGAILVPLDPAYPAERLSTMIRDAGLKIILTDGPLACEKTCRVATPVDWQMVPEGDEPYPALGPEAPAYMIYTSGTTGKPKGVLLSQGALCRLGAAQAALFAVQPGDRLLQLAALGFDVALGDIATVLAGGATLCLAGREGLLPGSPLARTLKVCRATHVQIPASLLAEMPHEDFPDLRVLVTGGETCPEETATYWRQGRQLFIAYGPTEATVAATAGLYGGNNRNIGQPLAGARLYILDKAGQPVPLGSPGELCIGGPGLALGYHHNPALTAARFCPDSFSPHPGARMYRTGDSARFLRDGTIEFLGRLDRQVKIRGFRVEPGEVEAVLSSLPGVARALVAPQGQGAAKGLLAWVLPHRGVPVDVASLRRALKRSLPPHLVPTSLTAIEAVPLTAHGKIDWEALPAPSAPPASRHDQALLGGIEGSIAEVWREVLGREGIDPEENFFDAGGNSLLLIRVHGALEKKLGRTLPVTELFHFPTIRSLGQALEQPGPNRAPLIQAREKHPAGPVAVIGLACRFPGAPNLESFWQLLTEGREGITHFTREELLAAGVPAVEIDCPQYVRARGIIPEAEFFDAAFFGYSPGEAELLDPQIRVFLECAWHALEQAGCDPQRSGGEIGLFAGCGANNYLHSQIYPGMPVPADSMGFQAMMGNEKDFLCTQVAYKLDLRGPAVTVQTACSTSLVAVDMAVQALRAGRVRIALAGGVAIGFPQMRGYRYEPGMILSPDGHCRPFAAEARGTVPGAGAGIAVLKSLPEALADGDRILAVIRGSALNNDGAAKVGYTAPSVAGQAAVIAAALRDAGASPGEIGYIEAHGTGTELGDPVEIAALHQVFGKGEQTCLLGSVKSNIGHADAAAGIAGFIKAVLMLHRGLIPPSLHFARPNPQIDFGAGPFRVADKAIPWPRAAHPRLAGVSSFGIGGTNVHVVLAEAPAGNERNEQAPALPLHSFQRQRFWRELPSVRSTSQDSAGKKNPSAWFYLPGWNRRPLPETRGEAAGGKWLIFQDGQGLGQALAERLLTQGRHVTSVAPGKTYARMGRSSFALAPGDSDAYGELFQALKGEGNLPAQIVHLFAAQPTESGREDLALDRGLYSLIHLVQAIGAAGLTAPLNLTVVTTGAQEVTGDEPLYPAQAAALGAVKVIPLEYRNITCRTIDLPDRVPEKEAAELILAFAAAGEDKIAALRGRYLWTPRYEPCLLPEPARASLPLQERGIYLITGGFGGMGKAIARHLARNFQARLILVGRSSLLEEGPGGTETASRPEETGKNIAFLRELESSGAAVLAFAADVSDAEAMPKVVAAVRARFGTINGVFHAAGVADYAGVIQKRSRKDTAAVLAAKIQGTLVLERLLDGLPLHFLVLFSTLGSVLYRSKFGQVGYAAANEFLDLYSPWRRRHKTGKTITINWDDWSGEGMTVAALRRRQATLDEALALTAQEGVEALLRIMAAPYSRVVVSVRDLPELAARDQTATWDLPAQAGPQSQARPRLGTAYAAPETEVERRLAGLWQELLGIDGIGIHDDFLELGGHSLLAIRFISMVRTLYGVELPLAAMFATPTIAGLAAQIEQQAGFKNGEDDGEIVI